MSLKLKNLKYNINITNFIKTINNITPYFEKKIKENTKEFKYDSKIKKEDLLRYRFKYIEKNYTFSRIVANINTVKLTNNMKKFNLSAISTKDNKIPSNIYKDMYNDLFLNLNEIFKFENKIIIVDGTYSNTNIKHNGNVETSMSLVFYDPENNLNIDFNFTGGEKKNNEKIKLQEYILNNIGNGRLRFDC